MRKQRAAGLVLAGLIATAAGMAPGGAAQAAGAVKSDARTPGPSSIGAAFALKNKVTDNCLDARQSKEPGSVYQWDCDSHDPNQNWLMEQVTSAPGWFSLRNLNSNLCLDLYAGNDDEVVNGTTIQQYFCYPDSIGSERWQVIVSPNEPRAVIVANQVKGKCLDTRGKGGNRTQIVVWDCNGSKSQKWTQE
ncbi:ricin-type beta-trefoil lectin domain protein [Streptomyces sp. So13.3]|uniref:RICIN domain-containing protein n=1 Tax=Streptomyces TaxID=1883 RepID=UPI001106A9FB|nr:MULTISPECIES: RICIN domain-containing protein [Streptomyces]MCZ4096901.1 RICIN domain-containing protein [Streptomyces sp. H39-C1]QNA70747.1 ricin-type beta-trefoil lectin domain protein [Streptomyces sp. So13.3]